MGNTIQNIVKVILWVALALVTVLAVAFAFTVHRTVRNVPANLQHVQLFGTPEENSRANALALEFSESANKRWFFQRVWYRGQAALEINHLARAIDARAITA